MVKQKLRDYDHVQVEITGFPPEPKLQSKVSVRQRIFDAIKANKRIRFNKLIALLGHSGHANRILSDMVIEGVIVKKKFDCGLCEYFELAEKKNA